MKKYGVHVLKRPQDFTYNSPNYFLFIILEGIKIVLSGHVYKLIAIQDLLQLYCIDQFVSKLTNLYF